MFLGIIGNLDMKKGTKVVNKVVVRGEDKIGRDEILQVGKKQVIPGLLYCKEMVIAQGKSR